MRLYFLFELKAHETLVHSDLNRYQVDEKKNVYMVAMIHGDICWRCEVHTVSKWFHVFPKSDIATILTKRDKSYLFQFTKNSSMLHLAFPIYSFNLIKINLRRRTLLLLYCETFLISLKNVTFFVYTLQYKNPLPNIVAAQLLLFLT